MKNSVEIEVEAREPGAVRLEQSAPCDVLVLGSGIAGINAALAASEQGSRVTLACKGKLFSGSSFYPGTWGLGLIGPESPEDEGDLADSISRVGCGMARPEMVRAFVAGITPAIRRVEQMGVKLRKAQAGADQREYIPCFDHKHRAWNGIEFESARTVFGEKLRSGGVTVLEGWEALELTRRGERVCGAVLSDGESLRYLPAKAVVLATGGYGSLFRHHLCTSDVEGVGQALALNVGCQLVNMEFMQIMPGYLNPAYGTVFNEKVFRFTELEAEGERLLSGGADLLALRSGHGPFTSRLASRAVDLAIDGHKEGVTARYSEELRSDPPEFVKTYFDWLKEAKGLTMDDPVRVGLFAHAANGGVSIRPDASTGVPGLFAAGEVTGGMHGADRIGGLSTANGLVFGAKAGGSAALEAQSAPEPPQTWDFPMVGAADCAQKFRAMQDVMTEHAMAVRTGEGLEQALEQISALRRGLELRGTASVPEVVAARRLLGQLETASAVLLAERLRTESRGSHYRADHPAEDPALAHRIVLHREEGTLRADFEPLS